jgi:PAS domain S-box-containing protein
MRYSKATRRQRALVDTDLSYAGLLGGDEVLEKQSSLLGFLEYLTEGVMVVDASRTIVAANNSLLRMLGYAEDELVGRQCLEIMGCQHPDSATSLCQNLCPVLVFQTRGVIPNTMHYHEVSVLTKNGDRREVSASFAPLSIPFLNRYEVPISKNDEKLPLNISNSAPAYSIIVFRDVTEHKRQERIKSQFIATASHQLRTPLSSIKTAIGLLLVSVGEDFSEPLRRLLQNIHVSTLRMERLVSDMIELTNLQSGRVQMQRNRIEVRDLVDRAVHLIRGSLETRKQVLDIKLPDSPLFTEADYSRISQVLGHLLSNASKFSPVGSIIELIVYRSAGSNVSSMRREEVVFCVRDYGVGISEEEKPLIFEKFYQSQIPENADEIGGGLGLPMAKALIELNGGRLWFESEQGKGSSFYFALPAAG